MNDIVENKSEGQCGNQFNIRAFGTDVLTYSAGQAILLLFIFIQGLILPKYLSMEGYGYLQLFLLYTNYVGLLHLGFLDGVLIRWAGKELPLIGGEMKKAFEFLLLQLVVVTVPLSLAFYFLLQPPFQGIALMVLGFGFVFDLGSLFVIAVQAVKWFKILAVANAGRVLLSLISIIILFCMGYLDYKYVAFALMASSLVFLLIMGFSFRRYLKGKLSSLLSLWSFGKQNTSIGIFVLLGNFVVLFFLTADRLMITSFFSIEQFAVYAFALTVVTIAYVFMGAVSTVFFPHLSGVVHELRVRAYQLGKPAIILVWAAFLIIYFPVAWLVRFYLPHYTASLPIMQILLCTVGFGSLIQVLHVNYYMAYHRQRRYLISGITALAVLVLSVILAIKVWGTLESVAVATVISFGIWYIINELSLKSVVEESSRGLGKGVMIICGYIGAFLVSSLITDSLAIQMLGYICFFCGITWLFYGNTVRELVGMAKEAIGR